MSPIPGDPGGLFDAADQYDKAAEQFMDIYTSMKHSLHRMFAEWHGEASIAASVQIWGYVRQLPIFAEVCMVSARAVRDFGQQLLIAQRQFTAAAEQYRKAVESDGKAQLDAIMDMNITWNRRNSASEHAAHRIERATAELPDYRDGDADPAPHPLPNERALGGQLACTASALTPIGPWPKPYAQEVAPGRALISSGGTMTVRGSTVFVYGGPVGWFIGGGMIVGGIGLLGMGGYNAWVRCKKRGQEE